MTQESRAKRIVVVADAEGNVIAAHTKPLIVSGEGAPLKVRLNPEKGQSVYELAVPDEVQDELHRIAEFRVQGSGGEASLVRKGA
ncbi:hypothetical protein ACH4MA_06195 [Streptomyces roseolus]|uniref:hypothetical protein n=1 Tax=Streptomyces roseolus TaxID=67358 RepID=UPI0037A27610